MTKLLLRFTVLIFISSAFFFSCKKTNSLHSYPENMRLLSFTKVTAKLNAPSTALPLNENYRFSYDSYNRLSQVIHTKDDGSFGQINTFAYSNDTIYDTARYINQTTILEIDSFVTDPGGLITITYEPGIITYYTYSGKLLARKAFSASYFYTFTSYNKNLLRGEGDIVTYKTVDYTYYTDKFNRIGDYLQLNSFLKYGYNFYQNDNLIHTIVLQNNTTSVDYVYDADNKITKTTAVVTDTSGSQYTEVYNLQYEQYK